MDALLNNKKALIIVIILAILAFVFLLVRIFYVPTAPTEQYFTEVGPNVDVVPTIPPDPYGNGGGLDINSQIVKESQQNIEIIKSKLPYRDSFKSSSGVDVTVYIPGEDRQTVAWELEANVSGIRYLRDPNESEYNSQRTAFFETVDRFSNWVKQNGGDPTKMYVSWSSNKDDRDTIVLWLDSR